MIQDIIRALIQKVMHDKILMALIAIGIAGIFYSGANHSEKKESVQSKRLGRSSADQPAIPGEQGQADQGESRRRGSRPTGWSNKLAQQAGQAQNHQAQTNQAQATADKQAAAAA
jgi:hypothetical protein